MQTERSISRYCLLVRSDLHKVHRSSSYRHQLNKPFYERIGYWKTVSKKKPSTEGRSHPSLPWFGCSLLGNWFRMSNGLAMGRQIYRMYPEICPMPGISSIIVEHRGSTGYCSIMICIWHRMHHKLVKVWPLVCKLWDAAPCLHPVLLMTLRRQTGNELWRDEKPIARIINSDWCCN